MTRNRNSPGVTLNTARPLQRTPRLRLKPKAPQTNPREGDRIQSQSSDADHVRWESDGGSLRRSATSAIANQPPTLRTA
jgi:hypothetical protein